jgi:hypothetical protein
MLCSAGCSLLRAEGFSCGLGVLYGGLGISKWQFLIKKIKIRFPAVNFFQILGHQTLDPDPGSGILNIFYYAGSPGASAAGYLLHPGGQDPTHGHLLPDPHLPRRDHRSVEGCRYCTVLGRVADPH